MFLNCDFVVVFMYMMCIFVGGSDGEALGMICIRGSYSKNKAFSSQKT